MGGKSRRGLVSQRTVRPVGIIHHAPSFDYDLGFKQRLEPLALQALISEFVVKTFNIPILPGLAWRNKGRANVVLFEPVLNRLGGEFAAIV